MKYNVILSSGPDMVMQKKSRTYIKDLVLMFSQNLFYIYDEENKSREDIEYETDENSLKNYFKELTNDMVAIPKGSLPFCNCNIKKMDLPRLNAFMISAKYNKALHYCVRNNLIRINKPNDLRINTYCIDMLYTCDPKIIKFLADHIDILSINRNEMYFICTIYNTFGYENFKRIYKYGIMEHFVCKKIYDLKPYNLNPARFAEYLTESDIGEEYAMDEYFDYLDMSYKTGSIKDKYPGSVKTAHDKMETFYKENEAMKSDYPEFLTVMSECEDFSFEERGHRFAIVMPEKSADIVNEGIYLGHCVSSYVPKIIAGDCMIVFMREKENRDTPYLTVEISKGRRLTEVEGMNKRTQLTESEIKFLKLFAERKGLIVEAHNVLRKNIAA